MNFEEIALNRTEVRLLKRSIKQAVPIEKCPRLLRLKLVAEEMIPVPGYQPKSSGVAYVTDLGCDYIAYYDRRMEEYRKTRLLAIISTIVSIVSLLSQLLGLLCPR